MTWEQMYDILHDVVGLSGDALDLAFGVIGCSTESAEDILYYATGWHSFEGYLDDLANS
jgi:hypothetical protein